MKKYTVVLIYPDYVVDQYGEEFYTAQVTADGVFDAIEVAQKHAVEANDMSIDEVSEDYCDPHDFACVALFEGWRDNINPY